MLSTCDTCRRILKEVGYPEKMEVVDIKKSPVDAPLLDQLHAAAGSYEALFNTRAQRLKAMGIKAADLTEEQRRVLLLEDYSFLRRPVFVVGSRVLAGNAKATVDLVKEALAAL